MTFAYPWVLFALAFIPVLALLNFAPRFRRLRQGTFVFSAASVFKTQPRGFAHYLTPVLDIMVLMALGLMVVGLARPQSAQTEDVQVEGIDIMVALDLSGSMRAIDLTEEELRRMERRGETPMDRFDSAVQTLREFVKSREHDRIGLVLFAKDAFLQFPLTLDHNIIDDSLARMRLGDIDENGTAIGNAMGRAISGLRHSEADTKLMILITDGDRRGGNISPAQAAQIAKELNIVVYPILVGRDGLALVPVGKDIFSGRTSYRQVEFPIDPELLKEIAKTTGGEYFRAQDGLSMRDDLKAILDEYDRSVIEDAANVDYTELYRPFVIWALVLLLVQFLLRHTLCRSFP